MSTATDEPPAHPLMTPVPLRRDETGVWRVGETNVTLETVEELFEAGGEADEIARELPALDLAAVYQVIAYFLAHGPEFAGYLAERRTQVEAARRTGAADGEAIRRRLLVRAK